MTVQHRDYDCAMVWYTGAALTVKGDAGDRVAEVQCLLKLHGYRLRVDGVFGDDTHEKVLDYQRKTGTRPNGGKVDPRTWAALRTF
ncbi:peptidoglycan-binding domain-containing protein [Streptomyces sp. NPDC049577]|uniref:peptidoglycan-binding domain-containing protein n=1 Tax=Streptomyces sp. NPDC049577 TaxID=3155153 RepID=UPI003415EFD7